jgi:predicted ArsR family transcriptional regulator
MNLDNQAVASPADRILALIKRKGPQSVGELARALAVSGEAARQQLVRLAEEGLVEPRTERRGVGRPSRVWRLTTAGDRRFPDAHAELTVRLLETVREELGAEALDRLITARERASRAHYAAAMAGAANLAERVARLTAERTREGYMAEWSEAEGGFLLVENHCPICAAARACQGFCRAELQVFREALGPGAVVERTEHIPLGARRCAYKITAAE